MIVMRNNKYLAYQKDYDTNGVFFFKDLFWYQIFHVLFHRLLGVRIIIFELSFSFFLSSSS